MTLAKLLAAALILLPLAAAAQEQGEAEQGRIYAQRVCAECHKIGKQGGVTDVAGAKSFKSVANRPGMSGMALAVWMQSDHPSMPLLMPEPDELNDVITYILSLKD